MDVVKEQLMKDVGELKQQLVTAAARLADLKQQLTAGHATVGETAAAVAGLVKDVADLKQQIVALTPLPKVRTPLFTKRKKE